METRSHSSSPDPLAYPGDPDYLLSSATKPFAQRRMTMTPFKSRTPRTPWSTKTKDKGAKAGTLIKYPDIILPSTPSGDRFDRKSLSPTKKTLQSESNISPWRIRVTVEAERDEDEENNNVIQDGVGNWMNGDTLRVPLKSGESSAGQTPRKPLGRKRKSDVSKRVPTPGRKKPASIFESVLDSTKKRKRGRPRKTLEPPEQNSPSPQRSPAKSIGDGPSGDDLFLDIAQGDFGGLGDAAGTQDFRYPSRQAGRVSTLDNQDDSPGNAIPNDVGLTPNIGERHDVPANTPFAQQGTGISPINVTFAGQTPMPRLRLYPTPTSSSQQDEELIDSTSTHIHQAISNPRMPDLKRRRIADPTEQHREFDSIMESEGFSMVSLTSLPSAKHKLLSSSQQNPTKPLLSKKPFQDLLEGRNTVDAKSFHQDTNSNKQTQGNQLRSVMAGSDGASPHRSKTGGPMLHPQIHGHKPSLSKATAASEAEQNVGRRPIVRLARIIRVGISFQTLLIRNWKKLNVKGPIQNSNSPSDAETSLRRIDGLFENFNLQTRKELSAGLRFGEVLARGVREAYRRRQLETTIADDVSVLNDGDAGYPALEIAVDDAQSVSTAPLQDEQFMDQPVVTATRDDSRAEKLDSEMARREAEWQREREAISRQIAEANASQVIVIDSDNGHSDEPDIPDMQEATQDVHYARGLDHPDEEAPMEYGNRTVAEDNEYEDIWQQEARQDALLSDSPSFADATHDDTVHPRRNIVVAEKETDYDQDGNLLELSWSRNQDPMRSLGKSQLARYRDKDFEFTSLIGTPESSTKRFILGGSGSGGTGEANHFSLIHEESLTQRVPSPPKVTVVVEDAQRYTRAPSALNESISDIPPPPSLKYTGSDLITNEQEEHPPVNHAPQPLEFSEEPRWVQVSPKVSYQGEHVGNQISPEGIFQAEIEMEHIPDDTQKEYSAPTTWFHRLTNLAPKWFTSSHLAQEARTSVQSSDEPVHKSSDPTASQSVAQAKPVQTSQSAPKPPQPHRSKKPKNKQLALSGYFTNDHYYALRSIYYLAKERPDRFPYVSTPERDSMLGMWMFSTDGHHYRQVTETQLAIVDKFRRDLVEAARRRGCADQLGWSEEDILWRLFSIIVGETIRAERKRQLAMESNPEEFGYNNDTPYLDAE